MQKWEYCAVAGIVWNFNKMCHCKPVLWNFTVTGVQPSEITGSTKGIDEFDRAKIIAQLGEEGWEMVSGESILYFNRPKS